MKWLFCLPLLFVFALAACGGGASSPTPSPTVQAAALTETDTAPTAVVDCDSPLPDGPVSFAGRVVNFNGPTPYQTQVFVFVQRITAQPGTAVHGSEQDWLGSVLNVTWNQFGDAISDIKTGDCVVGSGQAQPSEVKHIILPDSLDLPAVTNGDLIEVVGAERRYACGQACDAAGFLVTYLRTLQY